ncbi:MAG TPA: ATP-binding protein [Planctomycetota bacterium]|nr:ATP-binding protein [Planctomycetota bacterium]
MSVPTTDWQRRARAAEATVRVLKDKVLEMYGGGAQSTLHRALERAREREERNARKRALAELRSAELAKYNEHLESEVARRTRAIRAILDNVTFGFLVIDREMRVQEGVTLSCGTLLGRMPEPGDNLAELLGLTSLPREADLQLGVDQVFEDLLPEEVTLDQLPSRFELGERVLRVEGRVIRDDGGQVTSILLTISDATALELAQRESQERDVLIGVLRQKSAFEEFVADARTSLEAAAGAVADQVLLRRVVHTVKGNAASWGLSGVTEAAHDVEAGEGITEADLEHVGQALRDFLGTHRTLLNVDYEVTDPGYQVQGDELRALRALTGEPVHPHDVESWVSQVVQRPAGDLFGPVEMFVSKLAERLGKEVDFEIRGGDIPVDAEVMRPVLRNLSHLVRNAVDHGIEPAWERGSKSSRGRVAVTLEDSGEAWLVHVEDDGRGIQLDKLIERARKRGIDVDDSMPPERKIDLIFTDGLSTAEVASHVSGRGVGMSAVREAVHSRGGKVRVRTGPQGTRVTLEVPKPCAAADGNLAPTGQCAAG